MSGQDMFLISTVNELFCRYDQKTISFTLDLRHLDLRISFGFVKAFP